MARADLGDLRRIIEGMEARGRGAPVPGLAATHGPVAVDGPGMSIGNSC